MGFRIGKNKDFVLVNIVFALTGMSTAYVLGVVLDFFSVEPWTASYLIIFSVLAPLLYCLLLLFISIPFGMFNLFYYYEKKILIKALETLRKRV